MRRSLQVEARLAVSSSGHISSLSFNLSRKEMKGVRLFPCIVFMGEFQKIVWTEKEKLWTWMKKNGSPEERKNEIQRFTTACGGKIHLCNRLSSCSSQAGISLLLSTLWFLSCWAVKWARIWGVSSDVGPVMAAMNCQHCQGNQISQPSNFTRLTLRSYLRMSGGGGGPLSSRGPGPIGSWKNNYKRHSQNPHVSQANKNPKPCCLWEARLIFTILSDINRGETEDNCVAIKNNLQPRNLWWRVTALDDSSNLEKNLNISFLSIIHKPLSIMLGLLIFTTKITTEFFFLHILWVQGKS